METRFLLLFIDIVLILYDVFCINEDMTEPVLFYTILQIFVSVYLLLVLVFAPDNSRLKVSLFISCHMEQF